MFGDVTRVAPVTVFTAANPLTVSSSRLSSPDSSSILPSPDSSSTPPSPSMGLLTSTPLNTATIELADAVAFVVAVNSLSLPFATLKNIPAFKSRTSPLSTNKSAKSGSKFVTDISLSGSRPLNVIAATIKSFFCMSILDTSNVIVVSSVLKCSTLPTKSITTPSSDSIKITSPPDSVVASNRSVSLVSNCKLAKELCVDSSNTSLPKTSKLCPVSKVILPLSSSNINSLSLPG